MIATLAPKKKKTLKAPSYESTTLDTDLTYSVVYYKFLVPLFSHLWLHNRLQSDFDNHHSANQNMGSVPKFVQNSNNPTCIQGMSILPRKSCQRRVPRVGPSIHVDTCVVATCSARLEPHVWALHRLKGRCSCYEVPRVLLPSQIVFLGKGFGYIQIWLRGYWWKLQNSNLPKMKN